jgi:hypothetical protein
MAAARGHVEVVKELLGHSRYTAIDDKDRVRIDRQPHEYHGISCSVMMLLYFTVI